ncbi:MAG: phage tail protein [Cytophagia bacterium]|nr:phage tail protein [Cytophagia bacterium]
MTLGIYPLDNEKKIRIYKNYKNLEISFALVNPKKGILNENWSNHSGQLLNDSEIIELTIDKKNPFIKTFKGIIIDDKTMITLSIPELKMKVSFNKAKVIDGTSIRVHGLCNPIEPGLGDSLEDYFDVKDIKIIGE